MIPKTIHYCWFGRNPKPKLAEKCIKSWKKYCSDFQIIEWNEDNYDISKAPLYVRQAYDAKKWAFVTDYVRLQVVYENGGIYMDTDVELKKPLGALLDHQGYFGFEEREFINTGVGFGGVKGLPILKEIMEDYHNITFVCEDGTFDLTPCPMRNAKIFLRYGLRMDDSRQVLPGDILILPTCYLSPISYLGNANQFSAKTVSVHWYGASWKTEQERKKHKQDLFQIRCSKIRCAIGRCLFGESGYEKVKTFIKGLFGRCRC